MLAKLKNPKLILWFIIILGAVLRLYKMDWGDGFSFHPDERNIAFGINNLDFSDGKFNPQFWAYGSLPIYIVYGVAWLVGLVGAEHAFTFDGFIMVGRYLSALASIALIPLTYVVTTRILKSHPQKVMVGLLTALWVAFLPGMIQFAHFTTFETFLTLQYALMLIVSFDLVEFGRNKDYVLLGILLGLSIGTKIVSLALLPLLIGAHVVRSYNSNHGKVLLLSMMSKKILLALLLIPLFAFIASPFHLLDWGGFMNSLAYESGVADGSLPVFYTQQFIQTIPVLYQITRVFPFILTIPLTILSIFALTFFTLTSFYHLLHALTQKRHISIELSHLGLLVLTVLLYLGFHLTLYVKWTRYMIPALPFLSILVGLLGFMLLQRYKQFAQILLGFVSIWVILAGVSFWQLYTRPDTRIESAAWAEEHLDRTSSVTSEIYDLGIIPFNSIFSPKRMELLNIYDLEVVDNYTELARTRDASDLFISTSQRLWGTRDRIPETFPDGKRFYDELRLNPAAGGEWTKIADFNRTSVHCNALTLFCFNNMMMPDETFVVFDHPQIQMYRNTQQ